MGRPRWMNLSSRNEYTPTEKARIVKQIQTRHQAEGRPIKVLAAELGICDASYYNWSKAMAPVAVFRPVEVAVSPPVVSGVLITPQGHRVEGLTVAQLAELLQLLA